MEQKLIEKTLTLMGFADAQLEVDAQADHIDISITVPEADSGMLIGFRGEKINALQRILSLMLNRSDDGFIPVQVDINGYRAKRRQQIEDLADQAAQKAIESGKEIIMPAMNGYERRIVHLHLDKHPKVTTYSEGDGQNRHCIVSPQQE